MTTSVPPERDDMPVGELLGWRGSASWAPGGAEAEAPQEPQEFAGIDPARAEAIVWFDRVEALVPRPWLGPAAALLCAAVFVAMTVTAAAPSEWFEHASRPLTATLLAWGANFAPKTLHGEPWRLLTAAFLHAGLLHLLVNGYGLWQMGWVERTLGRSGFVAVFLVSAVAGSLASLLSAQAAVSVGVSGALCGLIGAIFSTALVPSLSGVPRMLRGRLLRSLLFVIVVNAWLGAQIQNIDNRAHAGGFVAGLLVALAIMRRPTPEAAAGRARRAVVALLVSAAVLAAAYYFLERRAAPTAGAHAALDASPVGRDGSGRSRGMTSGPSERPQTAAETSDPGTARRSTSRRPILIVLGLIVLAAGVAFGAYAATSGFLHARYDSPASSPVDPAASRPTGGPARAGTPSPSAAVARDAVGEKPPAPLVDWEARATDAMDRAETRWTQLRSDVREGRLAIDAAIESFRKECAAPLESMSALMSSADAGGGAADALRRERIRGRVISLLLTMDREALTLVEGEQQRATDAIQSLGEAAAQEREELRKARAAREAAMGSADGAGMDGASMADGGGSGGSGAK